MSEKKESKNNTKASIILEKPIQEKKDDKFNIYPYVEQLKEACKKGAIFIAVDGKFGSGKSSIVKLFEQETKDEKNIFVNVNFMNINAIPEKNSVDTNDNDENDKIDERKEKLIVNDYHRYFVNQVVNDLCKDPYEFERLFYNQKFSYTTLNLKKQTEKQIKYKYYIDRIILWFLGIISIYTIYESFFNKIKLLNLVFNFITPLIPIIVISTFILLIRYGYGFYKPDKNIQSPMLDTDKCRNNFLKVIKDYLLEDSTLYLVIDDLDRIDNEKLQLQVISLLFNEYYPLNKLINNIELKFIFMIDINKISINPQLKPQKVFDYILPISSNQKTILKHYTKKLIQDNNDLEIIFNVKNKEYFIGLIVSNFKEMRDIKHLLNNILTKYLYLSSKNITINYSQLIVLSILTNLDNSENIAFGIEQIINKTEKELNLNDTLVTIIKDNINSKIIDKNYYVYIYNFIDESNLLSNTEETIFDLLVNNDKLSNEKINNVYDLLNTKDIRHNVLFEECYKYINNTNKIIMLGNKNFYNYIYNNDLFDYEILNNLYLNNNAYNFYNNIKENLNDESKNKIINSLQEKFDNYVLEDEEDYTSLKNLFLKFVKNLKDNILDFNITKEIFNVIDINDDLFQELNLIEKNNHPIIYDLINNNILSIKDINEKIDENFINSIKNKDVLLSFNIEKKLLLSPIKNNIKKYIILNQEQIFNSIEDVFNDFLNDNDFSLSFNELKIILTKYNYNELLDKYIITHLKTNSTDMINLIKENNYELSNNVLDEINNSNKIYSFNDYYETLFKNKKYYNLLIYSQALNNKKFKLDTSVSNKQQYKNAIVNIYKNMNKHFINYEFTQGYRNMILNEFDFSTINFNANNFWKIDILIPSLNSIDKWIKIFDRLYIEKQLGNYATYCKNNKNLKNINFLMYVEEWNPSIEPTIKRNITIAINSKNKQKNKTEV